MNRPALAIDGGPPVRTGPWPPWPVFGEDAFQAAAEVLRSGRMTSLTGDAGASFEEAFAACGRTGFLLGPCSSFRQYYPWENMVACERAWRRLR